MRQARLFKALALAMKGAQEGVFDTWMKRQSDLVQAAATSFAEREVLEASCRTAAAAAPGLQGVLRQVGVVRCVGPQGPLLSGALLTHEHAGAAGCAGCAVAG